MTERKIRVLVAKPGLDGHERGAKVIDRKSTRLNSSHDQISYAVFCLKKKKKNNHKHQYAQRAIAPPHPLIRLDPTDTTGYRPPHRSRERHYSATKIVAAARRASTPTV